ncbi:MAG: hypothetical protein H0U42_03835, partial [Thermoleophilaceae bacterium]|nr:hypothetical protein [Thermoleophilaceae bacterium]
MNVVDRDRLRSDFEYFSRKVLKLKPWPHQLEAAGSEAFITTIAAARRTGKTTLAEALAIHTAFVNGGCKVLVLSATQDAARRITESIGQQLTGNPLTAGAVVDDQATRVRLSNGSEIVSLPASQRQVRGYGKGVLLVILDEAGFMASELWTAAHYTALDERARGSRILIVGTPWGAREHFFRRSFEAGRDGDRDHASFNWTYKANPLLDQAYLERQRDRVAPAEYAAEVLGEWASAEGSLFSHELLEENTAAFEPIALEDLRGPARPFCGLDWGVSYDRSAAAVIARLPIGRLNGRRSDVPIYGVISVKVWPAATRLAHVVTDVARVPIGWAVTSETNGVGAMPTQQLREELLRNRESEHDLRVAQTVASNPFASDEDLPDRTYVGLWKVATTAPKKAAAYGTILSLLEQNRLVLPRQPDLLRELAGLRYEITDSGSQRIEGAQHDDVADSLMLATCPRSENGKHWTRVGWISSHLRDPEADAPETDDLVKTGGGLLVPRRPAFQSLENSDLSL